MTISLIPTDGRHCSPAGWYDDVFTCFIFSFICSNFCCFKFGLLLLLWGPFLFAAGGRSRGKLRGFLNFIFKFILFFLKKGTGDSGGRHFFGKNLLERPFGRRPCQFWADWCNYGGMSEVIYRFLILLEFLAIFSDFLKKILQVPPGGLVLIFNWVNQLDVILNFGKYL